MKAKSGPLYYAVLLAGGSGERLWPISRKAKPKQFIDITGKGSLLKVTADRLSGLVLKKRIFVVAPERFEHAIRNDLKWLRPGNLIMEPASRNTGPAIALAAARVASIGLGDSVGFYLPADHLIENIKAFQTTLKKAAKVAQKSGILVTIGIKPTTPSSAYGYLKPGKDIEGFRGQAKFIKRFVEKPSINKSKALIKAGALINGGMFIWKTSTVLRELRARAREIYFDPDELSPDSKNVFKLKGKTKKRYSLMPSISIDYALMEKGPKTAVIPSKGLKWSDIGGYKAIHELLSKGNKKANVGAQIAIDSSRNLFMTDKLVACMGVDGLVMVEEKDAILICPMDRADEVKAVIKNLKKGRMDAYL